MTMRMFKGCAAGVLALACACAPIARAEDSPELLFPNSDFEKGDLTNWRAEGEAFKSQPTKGDNPKLRDKAHAALLQGNYFIATYDRYNGKEGEKPGGQQGDKPTGGIASTGFTIDKPFITFLIAGGGEPDAAQVQLIIDGKPVREAGGSRSDAMRRVYWDVKEFAGKKATLYVQDRSDKPWGHINCDDFRYAAKAEEALLFENSDFEKGDLSNWTADGDAFKAGQPVKGDTVKERSKEKHAANPQGAYWVGSAEPVFAKDAKDEAGSEKPTGTLKSKEFEIKHGVISFRLGGGAGKEDGVYLLVDGKVARWARGNRSDTLHFSTWDVTDLKGKKAVIEIRDKSSGAWGHISADDFRYGRLD